MTLPDWPDIERALGDFLAPLGTCGSETPKALQSTLPFIRITRTGGSSDRVTDTATVSVDVFASGSTAAKQVAGQVREQLLRKLPAATDHGLIDWARSASGPSALPPTDSGSLRLAVASYIVSMRRPAQ